MNSARSLIIAFTCFLLFTHCTKKQSVNNRTGIQFIPFASSFLSGSTTFISEGYNISDINFKPFSNTSVYKVMMKGWKTNPAVDQHIYQFSIDKTNKKVKMDSIPDSLNCNLILSLNSDIYIGYNQATQTAVKFNSTFNILKKLKIFTNNAIELNALKNGTFILTYYGNNPKITCFDENLNFKWVKSIPLILQFYQSKNNVCSSQNNFYVLEQNGTGYYVHIFDNTGKYIKRIASSVAGYYGTPLLIESENGFLVFSVYLENVRQGWLAMSSYDFNGNLVKEKIINTSPSFSSFENNRWGIVSSIIKGGNDYFFTISNSHTSAAVYVETRLVKINSNLEIVWAKTLENNRTGADELLNYDGVNFYNIGQSNWAGIRGFSVIKTDLEGVITN